MAKLMMFVCLALLISGVISASTNRGSSSGLTCGRHGDPCSAGCCANLRCHPYANRCQVQITADDLVRQRGNLRHVDQPRLWK